MRPRSLGSLLLLSALVIGTIGVSDAVAKKKKPIHLELHYSGAYEDETSATGYTQSVGVVVDPVLKGHKVLFKYFEKSGGNWSLLDTEKVAPDPEFGDAWALFDRSDSKGQCKLAMKYPGNKNYKTAKLDVVVDCETGTD